MQTRSSATARILASVALVAAAIALIAIVAGSAGGGGDGPPKREQAHAKKQAPKPSSSAASYVVKSGDTLTAIAQQTGVPVARLIALNPEIDPQILIAGETLKLR